MRYIRMLLWPVAMVYRAVVFIRNLLFDAKLLKSHASKVPVICIGNITAGGTGKTPHVEYMAELLKPAFKVAVLSRGYRRRSAGFRMVTRGSDVAEAGDEALQVKRKFPSVLVAVDRNRVAGIRRLMNRKSPPDVILLDDAFQHRYVSPGLTLLLVDYNRPVFRDMILPAGNLREPWRNAIRADIIIITKCPEKISFIERARFISRLKLRSDQDVFFTTFRYGQPVPVFGKKRKTGKKTDYKSMRKEDAGILLVTGIADPTPLRNFLMQHVKICDELAYADHHPFSEKDLGRMAERLRQIHMKSRYVFVTEKDAVRIRDAKVRDRQLRKLLYYVPVEVKFLSKGEKPFVRRISKYLKKSGKDLSL